MKKLIRSKTTKHFLAKEGGWTDDFSKAWPFQGDSDSEAAKELSLLDVEIYYSFHESGPCQYDFTSPLGEDRPEGLERKASFRILLRQQKGQKYLQPSGEWNETRATAREFATSLLAYWWAKEQQLLGVEVVMAYADAQRDVVSMRVLGRNPP